LFLGDFSPTGRIFPGGIFPEAGEIFFQGQGRFFLSGFFSMGDFYWGNFFRGVKPVGISSGGFLPHVLWHIQSTKSPQYCLNIIT
jgi:hypothetical protein